MAAKPNSIHFSNKIAPMITIDKMSSKGKPEENAILANDSAVVNPHSSSLVAINANKSANQTLVTSVSR